MIQRKLITCARYALVLSASALFVSGAVAQDEKKADETKKAPKTTAVKKTDKAVEKGDKKDGGTELATGKDKASYGIGINIGRSLKKDGWKVNPEWIARGISDAMAGKKQLLTDQELSAALQAFQKEIQKAMVQKNKDYLVENAKKEGIKVLNSGLQYKVLKAGDGASPKATDTVKTHYEGKLIDGTVFDSSIRRGQPATFPVNGVIKGWTEALQLMKVGDKWQLFVPSDLAYGSRGAGNSIGPDATLIFEVELLGIE